MLDTPPRNFFAALANQTRLRILVLLAHAGELCVCELTQAIGVSQPHISRQLAQLRESTLVADRRAGTWIYYRIHPELPDWARRVLRETATALVSTDPFRSDASNLATMVNRPDAPRCQSGLVAADAWDTAPT
ncbi:ArsR/SmtB family transcription factor [Thiorhodovibrio frisius]|uniref:Putative transcriptional regulator n=1 Tax=Thiorhodovibrio frisius TaxID=631362 RepID=H8YXT6_9GAMM|nr:metalloregulator ArsR/SmtB family transcription factor [Thiorhodovibrio frisius]EIC23262.1 putative transcriptional regulator [Thiorhodovibrio frisius]WPL23662.1 Arsenical resistance operon repressor [Thiorhodovibrio frisius]